MEPVERARMVAALRTHLITLWIAFLGLAPVGLTLVVYFVDVPIEKPLSSREMQFMTIGLTVVAVIEGLLGFLIPRVGWLRRAVIRSAAREHGPEPTMRGQVVAPFLLGCALLVGSMCYGVILHVMGAPQSLALKFILPATGALLLMGTYIPGLVDEYERALASDERYPEATGIQD